ncbi:fatty acid desaturase [SAR92 clade bacterium H231]|nr:fatty acid desaturase [SAR92 clade bacterium H231]
MNAQSAIADQADDLVLFKTLMKKPAVAWPTIILLVVSFVIFSLATIAHIEGALPLSWAILFNTIAAYMSFTPAHEASHGSVSANRTLNDWVGRLATVLQSPVPFFRAFRYIHMQHHRFTNDKTKDPDLYVGSGPGWLLPLKWTTLDINYLYRYLNPSVFMKRPKSERREMLLALLFAAVVLTVISANGWLNYYLLLFLIPGRITAIFLAITFDFLPHYPHQAQAKDQPFQCTSNRVGMEWLLTPVLLFQNYHLVHHLYPTVPFYRYLKIWYARKHYHQSQNPATTNAFSLSLRAESELISRP